MFDSIKTRLITLCISVVVLAMFISTAADYVIVRNHTHNQVLADLDALSAARAAAINQWIGSQRAIVGALAPVAEQAEPIPFLVQAAKSGGLEAAYIAHADKRIFFNSPQNLPPGYDPTGRPWFTQAAAASGTILTEPYMDAARKLLVVTFAQAVKDGGQTKAVVATDVFLNEVSNTVKAIKPTPNGFAFLVSTKGVIVAHPDTNLALKPLSTLSSQLDDKAMKQIREAGADWVEARFGEQDYLLRGVAIPDTDWILVAAADKSEAFASLNALLRAAALVLLLVIAVAGALMATMISTMLRGLSRVQAALDEISAGGGDLTQRLPESGNDEIARIAGAFNLFAKKIQDILLDVRQASNSITTASSEIALGAQDLSQRTEQTAANLEEAASSMETLTSTVRQTADAAQTANQLASSASAAAAKGGTVVSQVVTTMDEINTSSKKISDIIGVIDGIAFQTNILALNAAVEAARAGEQGRGFAVVASEVRSLAQRSAEAAKEIKGLIGASVDRVEVGTRLVEEAGNSMTDIVSSVQRVTDIIGEITAASTEQSDGIGQVNGAVVQLDKMTQQNAALVEESAAAAESLKDQAQRLTEVVSVFKLSSNEGQRAHGYTPAATPKNQHSSGSTNAAFKSSMKPMAQKTAPKPAPSRAPAPTTAAPPKPAAKVASPRAAAPAPASSGDDSDDWQSF
ncbi:methyl-accepting chemotaxis protein [Paucibacter sp. B2R-40]|uniref:methyl-accepting chemotaxis protein n=1 Tax=Paucibacter sp. B2R-40 TaxID=2893554 RepID=UPI0021E394AA|nr:methyl-accepting chemotaxis protein [Paucibacter sp. B2R-40]MCV2355195.1 methyl-accepting chemotaxis protein [Paucibacter sp. B2R-40]